MRQLSLCRIVFEGAGAGALVHRGGEAAERIDFAAGHRDGEMIAAFRQRRARAPRIGRRIVFIVIGAGRPVHRTAERVQLAVERDRRDFAARRRQAAPSWSKSLVTKRPVTRRAAIARSPWRSSSGSHAATSSTVADGKQRCDATKILSATAFPPRARMFIAHPSRLTLCHRADPLQQNLTICRAGRQRSVISPCPARLGAMPSRSANQETRTCQPPVVLRYGKTERLMSDN